MTMHYAPRMTHKKERDTVNEKKVTSSGVIIT